MRSSTKQRRARNVLTARCTTLTVLVVAGASLVGCSSNAADEAATTTTVVPSVTMGTQSCETDLDGEESCTQLTDPASYIVRVTWADTAEPASSMPDSTTSSTVFDPEPNTMYRDLTEDATVSLPAELADRGALAQLMCSDGNGGPSFEVSATCDPDSYVGPFAIIEPGGVIYWVSAS